MKRFREGFAGERFLDLSAMGGGVGLDLSAPQFALFMPGPFNWVAPANGSVVVMALGGGGSGCIKKSSNDANSGGGGGGAYCRAISDISEGDVITGTVGSGAPQASNPFGNNTEGVAGEDTILTCRDRHLVAGAGGGGMYGSQYDPNQGKAGAGGIASGGDINSNGGKGGLGQVDGDPGVNGAPGGLRGSTYQGGGGGAGGDPIQFYKDLFVDLSVFGKFGSGSRVNPNANNGDAYPAPGAAAILFIGAK